MKRSLLYILISLMLCTTLVAKETLQMVVIPMQHRTAEEAVSLLKPFVHPDGTVSGTGYTLVIRSTPGNIEDLKALLVEFDTALKRLLVSVAFGSREMFAEQQSRLSVEADSQGIGADVTVIQTQRRSRQPAVQQLQVIEGQWAKIQTGRKYPVRQRRLNPDGTVTHTVSYELIKTGFEVFPHVAGKDIILKIRPYRSRPGTQNRRHIEEQSLETTIRGPLGQWIELGGAVQQLEAQQPGLATQARHEALQGLHVKVNLLQ